MMISLMLFVLHYPFYCLDVYYSWLILMLLSSLSILLLVSLSLSGYSKYSMSGMIRLISSLLSYELVWSTIIIPCFWSWNDLSITNYYFYSLPHSGHNWFILYLLRSDMEWRERSLWLYSLHSLIHLIMVSLSL